LERKYDDDDDDDDDDEEEYKADAIIWIYRSTFIGYRKSASRTTLLKKF